jgi:hypothetical protein
MSIVDPAVQTESVREQVATLLVERLGEPHG